MRWIGGHVVDGDSPQRRIVQQMEEVAKWVSAAGMREDDVLHAALLE